MSSSRAILIFLAVVFLLIVIFSGSRIADALKKRFGKYIPSPRVAVQNTTATITPSPTQTPGYPSSEPTIYNANNSEVAEIPQTGPSNIILLVLVSGLTSGLILRQKSKKTI